MLMIPNGKKYLSVLGGGRNANKMLCLVDEQNGCCSFEWKPITTIPSQCHRKQNARAIKN